MTVSEVYNEEEGELLVKNRWIKLHQRLQDRLQVSAHLKLEPDHLREAKGKQILAFVERWYSDIKERMTEPQRAYHTLQHLYELFQNLDKIHSKVADVDVVELAIFFHDIVYQTKGYSPGQNEHESAELFLEYANQLKQAWIIEMGDHEETGLKWQSATERVETYIRATANHDHTVVDDGQSSDGNYFLDLDLLILAASEDRYHNYTQQVHPLSCIDTDGRISICTLQVRHEYTAPHGPFSRRQFLEGRLGFLASFLSKEQRFFRTMDHATEDQSRKNMAMELQSLRIELETTDRPQTVSRDTVATVAISTVGLGLVLLFCMLHRRSAK